jgi:ankyrin repeat protein
VTQHRSVFPRWTHVALLAASVLWACDAVDSPPPTPPGAECPTTSVWVEASSSVAPEPVDLGFDGDPSEALWRAAKTGDLELVTQLLQRSDLNLEFSKLVEFQAGWQQSGFTPLAHAVLRRDQAMMKLLLEHGARVDERVVVAAVQAEDLALVESMVSLASSPQAASAGFGYACHDLDLPMIRKLLDLGADVNAIGDWGEIGRTCLGFAAIAVRTDVIDLLLAAGADLEARDQMDGTAFMAAIDSGSLDGAAYLAKRGARTDAYDEHGYTALHYAVSQADLEAVEWLLARKADPNARDDDGETPIFMTRDDEGLACVKALLEAGANADARNDSGLSAAHGLDDDMELRRYLISKGARPS